MLCVILNNIQPLCKRKEIIHTQNCNRALLINGNGNSLL